MTVIITRTGWLTFRTKCPKDVTTNYLHLTSFRSKNSSKYSQKRNILKFISSKIFICCLRFEIICKSSESTLAACYRRVSLAISRLKAGLKTFENLLDRY